MKLEIEFLDNTNYIEQGTKNPKKKCIAERIIENFPEGEHRDKVTEIIEEPKFSAIEVLKIIRKTGIASGSEGTILKHRRKDCCCYI